jgi:spore germination protein KB
MKKILTGRQAGMLLFISIISLKFLVFPALITTYARRDAYISIFASLTIEFAIIIAILLFINRYPNVTFKDVISMCFGKVFAKIIYVILFVYFFCKTLFLIKETHNYFLEVIFDSLPWFFFTMPLTVFICYVMSKSIKSMARSVEIMFWIIIVCVGATTLAPLHRIDILNIFPMLEYGVKPAISGMIYSSFSFGDFIVLLLFMGKINVEKGAVKKIFWYAFGCVIFVTIFYVVFVAIFDNSGVKHISALSDISVRSSYPYTQEKLDWLAVLIWTIILIFQVGVYATLTKDCLNEVICFKFKTVPIAIIAGALFIASLFLYLNLELIIKVISSVPFIASVISIHILLAIILVSVFIILHFKHLKPNRTINNLQYKPNMFGSGAAGDI